MGGSAAMEDVEEETVKVDGAVRARAIVKGIAMVSSVLQQGSHRSRTRRSMCDICGICSNALQQLPREGALYKHAEKAAMPCNNYSRGLALRTPGFKDQARPSREK